MLPTLTPYRGVIWVHPDLLHDDGQWTTVSWKKFKAKSKHVNVIITLSLELDSDINSLIDSEKEEDVLATETIRPPIVATRSGQPDLRNYDESQPQSLELT